MNPVLDFFREYLRFLNRHRKLLLGALFVLVLTFVLLSFLNQEYLPIPFLYAVY